MDFIKRARMLAYHPDNQSETDPEEFIPILTRALQEGYFEGRRDGQRLDTFDPRNVGHPKPDV
jgi:hypothetical protein